jgi:putative SOS response-associated peptidase YedK
MFLPDLAPDELAIAASQIAMPPRFNIAPTQLIACVGRDDVGRPRRIFSARWGLIPSWAKDLAIGNKMINARGETVDSKPSFRKAFAARRCLIPADGYYEWMKTDDGKQPYLIERPDHGMLAMAGLWEINKRLGSDDQPVVSCTIITTNANRTTSPIHDRMPVFLRQADHEVWLDPGVRDTDQLKSLLVAADEDLLRPVAVSRRVNSPKNDDAGCIEPVESQ